MAYIDPSLGKLPAPVLSADPASSVVAVGSKLRFTCASTIDTSNRNLEVKLFLNSELFAHTINQHKDISNMLSSFSGTYTCIVIIDGVESEPSNDYVLTVSGEFSILFF